MEGDDARQSEDWAAVADAVKDRAAERGLTQQQLASKANVSLSTIQELWRGLPRKRHPRILAAVSRALGWQDSHLGAVLNREAPTEGAPQPGQGEFRDELVAIKDEMAQLMRRLDALGQRLEERS